MLHPFIPFVTEELFSYLDGKETLLTLEAWPTIEEQYVNASAEADIGTIVELLTLIRNVRAQWNIKPNESVECVLIAPDKTRARIEANAAMIQRLVRISAIKYGSSTENIKNAATGVVGDIKFFIPLGALIDLAKEKARISAEVAQMEKASSAIEGRLSNEGFVQKAPPEVIEKERARMLELKTNASALKKALECLV
jgi:valyl-tRNA synthetase